MRHASLALLPALALVFAGHASAQLPTPVSPVKPIVTAPVKLPPGVKPTTPLVFQPSAEVLKLANTQLSAAKKTAKPIAGEAPSITINMPSQPGGAVLDFMKASFVSFGSGEPRAYFKSTVATDFVAEAPRVEVTFPARASNLYVVDCPINGVGDGHYRLSFAPTGAVFGVRETRAKVGARMIATFLADRDGQVRVAFEGHLVDGEDYLWGFGGCRLTTIAYG